MWQLIVVLLCVVTASRQAEIIGFEVPEHGVAAGENATLICRHEFLSNERDQIVKWWWKSLYDDGDKKEIYQRVMGQKQLVTVEGWNFATLSESEDSLVIFNIQPFQSGTFECEVSADDTGSEVRKQQDLLVYTPGSCPELNYTYVDDGDDEDVQKDIVIECSAIGVSPLPELEIKVDGHAVNASESISDPEDGLYNVTANVTLSSLTDGTTIDCDLYFNSTINYPPYRDSMVYQASGFEESTTEADIEPTAVAINQTADQEPHIPDGVSRVTFSMVALLMAVLQFLALQ